MGEGQKTKVTETSTKVRYETNLVRGETSDETKPSAPVKPDRPTNALKPQFDIPLNELVGAANNTLLNTDSFLPKKLPTYGNCKNMPIPLYHYDLPTLYAVKEARNIQVKDFGVIERAETSLKLLRNTAVIVYAEHTKEQDNLYLMQQPAQKEGVIISGEVFDNFSLGVDFSLNHYYQIDPDGSHLKIAPEFALKLEYTF